MGFVFGLSTEMKYNRRKNEFSKIRKKIVQELDFSQSSSLKPRFQSVLGSFSQSHSGFGGGYCFAPATVVQASVLEVEALVKLSAMMLASELRLGTCWTKILVSR